MKKLHKSKNKKNAFYKFMILCTRLLRLNLTNIITLCKKILLNNNYVFINIK